MRAYLFSWVAFSAALFGGCSAGAPLDGASGGASTATEKDAIVAGADDRLVPLFVVRVTSDPNKLNLPGDGHIRNAVEDANDIYARTGIRFVFQRVVRAVVPAALALRDDASGATMLTRDDVSGLIDAFGLPADWNAGLTDTASHWRARFETYIGTNYLTVWADDYAKSTSAITDAGASHAAVNVNGTSIESFPHEAGHLFGLHHTFDLTPNCDSWDLIFNQVNSTTQQFFTSHADCDAATTRNFHRIDPGLGNATADSSGAITITPSCGSGCTNVTYHTGDSQIIGYARTQGAGGIENAYNVMSYGTQIVGMPDKMPRFLSDSQIEVVRNSLRKNTPNGGAAGKGGRTYLGHRIADNPIYPVDFDGDNRRDIVTWTPPAVDCTDACLGTFAVLLSSHLWSRDPANMITQTLGVVGAQPVIADYDGDGKADLAVFEPQDPSVQGGNMFWRYCPSSLGNDCSRVVSKAFGTEGDVPIPRTNFIGTAADGEIASFRPSENAWRYGEMCKPGSSGPTTCVSHSFGPFSLGDAESTLMPDLWDEDDKTDFAVYNARTATLSVRTSTTNYSTTTFALGSDWVVQTDASDPNDTTLYEDQILPMYRPLGSPARSKRSLGLYSFGRGKWLTQWDWRNQSAATAVCAFAADVPFNDGDYVGGVDYNDDGYSDRIALVPTANAYPTQELRVRPSSSTTCGAGETTVAVPKLGTTRSVLLAVSDMTGDGKPDLLMIDDTAGRLQILDPHSGFRMYRTITFGGPETQFL